MRSDHRPTRRSQHTAGLCWLVACPIEPLRLRVLDLGRMMFEMASLVTVLAPRRSAMAVAPVIASHDPQVQALALTTRSVSIVSSATAFAFRFADRAIWCVFNVGWLVVQWRLTVVPQHSDSD